MKVIRVEMIGTGYMGKAHAIAFKRAQAVFPLSAKVVCEMVAEVDTDLAAEKAEELGFNRSTGDWQQLVNDLGIDVVDICSPNYLHEEIALALNAADALEMTLAAERSGVKTLVGFNYAKNPTLRLTKEVFEQDELRDIVHFRGTFNEDYLADANISFSWRLKRQFSGLWCSGRSGFTYYYSGSVSDCSY